MPERALQPLRILRSAAGYVWSILSLVFFVPLGVLALPVDRRQWIHDRLSTVWARGILACAGARLVVHGTENVSADEHYVIVANHQSLLDAMVMVAALQPLTPVRMVAKQSLFRIPVLGWGMRAFGHMPVDRHSMRASLPGLRKAQDSVRQRWSTVFFPEGTRSPDGRLLPFHRSAFHIAARAGVRVLPVTLSGSRDILPRGRAFSVRSGEIHVQLHPPLSPVGQSPQEVRELAETCRQLMEKALAGGAPADSTPAGGDPGEG